MTSPAPHSRFVLGATRVELDALAVHRDGASEALTPIEASLLQRLFDAKGATVPTGTLLEEVWGYRADTKTRTLVTTVSRVRKKIEIDAAEPTHLVTARGQGLALLGAEPLRERTSSRSRVLVGREEDVRAALEAVGQHRITVITGPVGVGKSAVATEVAVRHDDAVRVDVHGRPTVGEIGAALAVTLGERVPPDMRGILQAVADRSPGLVVLDGLDPTPDLDLVALAAVAPVLVTGPPTGLPGERILRLGPLADGDAQALLEAELARQSLEVAPELLERTVRRAEALPLALLVLAPLVGLFGEPGLELAEPELAGALRGAVERLDTERRRALAQLALFTGEFDVAAAAAVLGAGLAETMAHVRVLVDRGLVARTGPCFHVLRAARPLLDTPTAARERWLAWLRTLRDSAFRGGGALAARHADDLREGLRVTNDPEVASDLTWALADHLILHAPGPEPAIDDVAARFRTQHLVVTAAGIAFESHPVLPAETREMLEPLAMGGDLMAMSLVARDSGTEGLDAWRAVALEMPPGDPAMEARFLSGLISGAPAPVWLQRTAALRVAARAHGWSTVQQLLDVSYSHILLQERRYTELVAVRCDLDAFPPKLRWQLDNLRAAGHLLSGDVTGCREVLRRSPPNLNVDLMRRAVAWWLDEPQPDDPIEGAGRLTPTARLTSQAFHQILAGEVPHTGRPTFDALFGDDPPKLELIPALAVLLDRWRRDRGR